MSSSSEPAPRRLAAGGQPPAAAALVRGRRAQQAPAAMLLVATEQAQPVDLEALADEAREQGYARGYAAGAADARSQGELRQEEERRALAASIGLAASGLREQQAAALAALTREAAELALALTEALLGRELSRADAPARDSALRALALRPEECTALTLRVHPDSVAELAGLADSVPGVELSVLADPAVAAPGAIVQAGSTRVDAQLSTALARVRRALLEGSR